MTPTRLSSADDRALDCDDTVGRQVASATKRLRRYRLARDRARLARLAAQPELARAVAALLRIPA